MAKLLRFVAISIATAIGLCVVIVVGAVFIARQGHGLCSPDVVKQTAESPDSRWVARIGVCGALSGSFYYFDMARRGEPAEPDVAQSFEIVGNERPVLRWIDARTVEISLPSGMRPGTDLEKYKGATIQYTHRQ